MGSASNNVIMGSDHGIITNQAYKTPWNGLFDHKNSTLGKNGRDVWPEETKKDLSQIAKILLFQVVIPRGIEPRFPA